MTSSAMSIPAVTPPPVKMMPSRTTRAGSWRYAEVGELVAPGPVAGGAFATQQARRREQQRAGAHRGDVARLRTEPADGGEIGLVFDGGHRAEAAGHAEQVALIDAVQAAKPGEAHDGIHFELATLDRSEHAARAGQASEHLVGSGEVELGDAGKEGEDDVEGGGHEVLLRVAVIDGAMVSP